MPRAVLAERSPLRRALASLARALPEKGTLARLRLIDDLSALPLLCRCRPVRAGDERGILVVALEGAGEKPTPAALAAFFTGTGFRAAVIDARGSVVAEGAPGAADAVASSTPSAEFSDAGRSLRLYVVERAVAPAFRRPRWRLFPSPALDGPGLSMIAAAFRSLLAEAVVTAASPPAAEAARSR